MRRSTHIIFGVAIAYWILRGDPLILSIGLFASAVGSVLPDVDLKFKHRKSLHNLLSIAATAIVVYFALPVELFRNTVVLGLTLGWMSHLLLDLITKKGVALFYPISGYFFKLGLCRSDSIACNTLIYAISFALLALKTVEDLSYWLEG